MARRGQRERGAQTSSLPSLIQIDRSARYLVALRQTRFGPWLVSANFAKRQKIEMRPQRTSRLARFRVFCQMTPGRLL